jgi:ZPR1 zinc finger protein
MLLDQKMDHVSDEIIKTDESSSNTSRISYEAEGEITVLKSLCMSCEEQGTTRLLLTRIPFFRDVILMAFECPHCGFRSSEVQSAEVQSRGCCFTVTLTTKKDLNRQLVKGEKATVSLPELEFEIPAGTQGGVFTTAEGLLDRAIENLNNSQTMRRAIDPEGADAVENFLIRLRTLRDGESFPFTLVLDDPTGNSFFENPCAPLHDPNMKVRFYTRSAELNASLGLVAANARTEGGGDAFVGNVGTILEEEEGEEGGQGQVLIGSGTTSSSSSSLIASLVLPPKEGGFGQLENDETGLNEADDSIMVGSIAVTTSVADVKISSQQRDMSGNVPGGFKKGGALITRPTERAVLTDSVRSRAGIIGEGTAFPSVVFDSSATGGERDIMLFPQDCFNCSAAGEVRMCSTDVPHFKEVILMSFACDECGWKNVEVKGGGAVPPFGTISELRYVPGKESSSQDMIRDVIKGDSASVELVEIDVLVQQGSLGGLYTTVEGLLTIIRDKLFDSDPFSHEQRDSLTVGGLNIGEVAVDKGPSERETRMTSIVAELDAYARGEKSFTLKIQDPMANTWIYSPYADGIGADKGQAEDPSLTVTHYTRSEEEDIELGLKDMNAPEDMGIPSE